MVQEAITLRSGKINDYFHLKPEIKHIIDKIITFSIRRTYLNIEYNPIFIGLVLGIGYGMMIDLGYRMA